jgi:hypothetical protein
VAPTWMGAVSWDVRPPDLRRGATVIRSPLTARRIGLFAFSFVSGFQASAKGAQPAGLPLAVKRSHQNCSVINQHNQMRIDDDRLYDRAVRRTTKRRSRRTSCGRIGELSMTATLIPTGSSRAFLRICACVVTLLGRSTACASTFPLSSITMAPWRNVMGVPDQRSQAARKVTLLRAVRGGARAAAR